MMIAQIETIKSKQNNSYGTYSIEFRFSNGECPALIFQKASSADMVNHRYFVRVYGRTMLSIISSRSENFTNHKLIMIMQDVYSLFHDLCDLTINVDGKEYSYSNDDFCRQFSA